MVRFALSALRRAPESDQHIAKDMEKYRYNSNGVDYDPDLIYDRDMRPGSRRDNQPRYSERFDPEKTPDNDYNRYRDEETRSPRGAGRRPRQQEQEEDRREQRRRQPEGSGSEARKREPKPKRIREPRAPRKPISEWAIVKFLSDKRLHAVLGVGLVFIAVYISVAAISFFRSGGEDQSVVTSLSTTEIAAGGVAVENAAGPLGANIANSMIVEGLGLGSLALIVYMVVLGLSLMGLRKMTFWSLTFKTLLVGITVSLVFGLLSLWTGSDYNLGGYHGKFINLWLVAHTDWIGTVLVSAFAIVAVFYVYINDIYRLINRYNAIRRAHRERAEQLRLEREEDRQRVREAMEEADLRNESPDGEYQGEDPSDADQVPPVAVGFDDRYDNVKEDPYAIPDHSRYMPQQYDDEGYSDGSGRNGYDRDPYDATENDTHSSPDGEMYPADYSDEPQHDTYYDDSTHNNIADDDEEEELPPHNEPVRHADPEPAVAATPAPVSEPAAAAPAAPQPAIPALHPATPQQPPMQAPEPELDVIVADEIEEGNEGHGELYDPTAELSHYIKPSVELLRDIPQKQNTGDIAEQEENQARIRKTLNDYGIEISKIKATVGPTVTLYEIIPAEGVRIAKIKRLEDDIALSLAALGIRIIAPMPGKGTIGIEVPNKDPQTVSIRSILSSKRFIEGKETLPLAMGATISNEVFVADLCKMPHLLVAGATGMGKSVGLNAIIASLLYKRHPAELKFVLIDPKMVEFSLYSVLEKHFLAKLPEEEEAVVTQMDKVLATLNSLCVEMDNRLGMLRDANVRSIAEYNDKFIQKRLNPTKGHRFLPYIVVIVDEFADLIMVAGKEVEKPVARIAQKARAVGIHMIVATQRPSTDVITGLIKNNFPGRIAFRVTQMVDSKTILDRPGANQLIGKGDMLFSHNGALTRVQCAFIDTPEVEAICEHIEKQAGYPTAYPLPEPAPEPGEGGALGGSGSLSDRDVLFNEVAEAIVQSGFGSTSSVQRRFGVGFARAGKIMDQLEAAGIVGPATGGKPRTVLVDMMGLQDILRTLS